ncbi:hypothetical protein QA601_11495 [Chitinispirillales bacterium ANBcel5]|uniref:glucosamine inositolphosphorylceramide transferase family protein n=1 Tax=Cellulosispirillum alkaliphilum TaxID=3039283 RepID=UPI002A50AA6E|nr:hypothetical protein [Chitinispirillales bacterium ANBcel5]
MPRLLFGKNKNFENNGNDKPKNKHRSSIRIGKLLFDFSVVLAIFSIGYYMGRERMTPFINTVHEYKIGIYEGNSPLELNPMGNKNPVMTASMVTDVKADFVADPFIFHRDSIWYLFFEILERTQNKGIIGLAVSEDLKNWKYDQVVLEEPFHLSYPMVFEYQEKMYMIPESGENYTVSIYQALNFPYDWVKVEDLVKGNYVDPTVFEHDGHWYMFAGERYDILHLYHADDLFGDWKAHPKSPLRVNDLINSRPCGRVVRDDEGRLLRFAMNNEPTYGWDVRAYIVTELSPESYSEEEYYRNPILYGTGKGWNSVRMHHIDAHQFEGRWVAAVDGVGFWRTLKFSF